VPVKAGDNSEGPGKIPTEDDMPRQRVLVAAAIAVLAAACADSPDAQAPQPDAGLPGVQTISIAKDDRTTFEARVWYRTRTGTLRSFGANAIRAGYQAVEDGVVALAAPAPLVILIHGTAGVADSMAWIARDLVAHGAIVVAANHPASTAGDPDRRSILDVWEQPEDVRALIIQLERSTWSARIDPKRMAGVGFSLGEASAMLLAGARLEFERFPAFCKSHADGACEALKGHFGSSDPAFFAKANADHSEPTFPAVASRAPVAELRLVLGFYPRGGPAGRSPRTREENRDAHGVGAHPLVTFSRYRSSLGCGGDRFSATCTARS
jgi:predicted dienelactone hydrolase